MVGNCRPSQSFISFVMFEWDIQQSAEDNRKWSSCSEIPRKEAVMRNYRITEIRVKKMPESVANNEGLFVSSNRDLSHRYCCCLRMSQVGHKKGKRNQDSC